MKPPKCVDPSRVSDPDPVSRDPDSEHNSVQILLLKLFIEEIMTEDCHKMKKETFLKILPVPEKLDPDPVNIRLDPKPWYR